MALTGEAFGFSLAFNVIIALGVFLFFGAIRRAGGLSKFYQPKRYMRTSRQRPKVLPNSVWGWIVPTFRYKQDEVVAMAGYDAAMYLRILAFGCELFFFVTLWVAIVVLPTNLSGRQVERLIGTSATQASNFTYWVPPPPPPAPPGVTPQGPSAPPKPIKAPDFYAPVPPAPPGLQWWHYRADVPPLPQPEQYFHSKKYRNWGWRYDKSYQVVEYTFSNLDLTTLANISNGDTRLWVHLVSAWVISWYVWRLLWRYNKEAVALRIAFFTSARPGGVAHTVLVRDIPGLDFGTLPNRLEDTALRFLPRFVKRRLVRGAQRGSRNITKAVNSVLNLPARATQMDTSVHGQPVAGIVSAPEGTDVPTLLRSNTVLMQKRAQSADMGQLGSGGDPMEVITEVDAWDKACAILESGCTPQQAAAHSVRAVQMVERQFESLFPGKVLRVHMAHDTREIDSLVSEYWRLRRKLLDQLDDYSEQRKRLQPVKPAQIKIKGAQYGEWGIQRYGTESKKVDAVEFYKERIQALAEAITKGSQHLLRDPETNLPAAFVTFKTRTAQAVASNSMLHQDRTAWLADAAPEPRDVIWSNLGWRMWERQLRAVLCWAVFFVMIAFYLPVVAAIQALLQIEKLVDLPGVRWLVELPLLSSVLAGILPQLVLRLFFSLMPYILGFLERLEGLPAESDVEFGVVRKYFAFQVLTIFFATFLAGSFFNQVQLFVNDPTSVVRILGAAAPQTASFFMSYLLLLGLTTKPVLFLRIPQLVMYWIGALCSSTERAKARLWKHQYIDYGYEIPDNIMALLLGLTFCIISPLIAPIALLYFVVNSVIGKYTLIYVYAERFQSGGKVWQEVSGQIYFSALTFQIIMLGLFLIKGGAIQTILTLPLPILTISLWRSSDVLFRPPQQRLSLEAAADLDRRDEATPLREDNEGQETDQYLEPALRVSRLETLSLAAEAEDVEAQSRAEEGRRDTRDSEESLEVQTEDEEAFLERQEMFYATRRGKRDSRASSTQPLLGKN